MATSSVEEIMEGQTEVLTGKKHDSGKVRLELLSPGALEEVARVMTHGAVKYGDNNWRGGFKWTRVIGAVKRHVSAWEKNEDLDPEFGTHHLAHAICGLMFLLEFYQTGVGQDDRFKGNAAHTRAEVSGSKAAE